MMESDTLGCWVLFGMFATVAALGKGGRGEGGKGGEGGSIGLPAYLTQSTLHLDIFNSSCGGPTKMKNA